MAENRKKGLTAKERQHFRDLILKKREETMEQLDEKRLSFLDNSPGGNAQIDSNYAYHMADVGTDAQEREKAFMHYTREYKYLNFLNEALNRVDNDPDYGFCVECGVKIPNDRLEEVPHTRHCVDCKSKIK